MSWSLGKLTPEERLVLLNRRRHGEYLLCQFPDERCDAPRHMGTHFCESHIGTMRERACEEIRASYGMCAEEESLV